MNKLPLENATQAANAWRVLFLLFLANLFNFFDRTIPAIIVEPIRLEWHLSDFQLGMLGTAFTLVYAIAGLPLGRMADNGSRKKLMGCGLAVWSGLTAVNGMVGSFWTFLLVRMGVGIGEASYAPAANSLIGEFVPCPPARTGHGPVHAGSAVGLAAGVLYHRCDGKGVRQLACAILHCGGARSVAGRVVFFHQGAQARRCRKRAHVGS